MVTLTKTAVLSDILLWEVDRAFCREALTVEGYDIKATAGDADIAITFGTPLSAESGHNYVPAIATAEADVDALALETVAILAGETAEVACLVRGPGRIRYDQLPTTDQNGDSFTMATLEAALLALGLVAQREPVKQETLT